MKNNKVIKSKISFSPETKSNTITNSSPAKVQKSDQSEKFLYMLDDRSEEDKKLQNKVSEEIYQSNLRRFRIEMTNKDKVEYKPSKLFKVEFPNEWFAMITDN